MGKILILAFLLVTFSARAEKRAYFWGGGGEPFTLPSTKFDPHFEAFVRPLLQKGWVVKSLYGQGHPGSERLVRQVLGDKAVQEFSLKNVQLQLKELKEDLSAGKISQVLFVIATHGEDPLKHPTDLTHRIYLSDPGLKKNMSLDVLVPIQELTEKLQLPLAILDLSCYSGATLTLAGPKTCVVAASSSQDVSYDDFTLTFAGLLASGSSLESAFLRARNHTHDFAGPEISTPGNSLIKGLMANLELAVMPHKKSPPCHACTLHSQALTKSNLAALEVQDLSDQERGLLNDLVGIRQEATQSQADYASAKKSFDENEAIKLKSLIQFFFKERQLYQSLYPRLQSQEPTICRQFQL